jgi:2-methylaconitate cis-trans-isomerase PrpF
MNKIGGRVYLSHTRLVGSAITAKPCFSSYRPSLGQGQDMNKTTTLGEWVPGGSGAGIPFFIMRGGTSTALFFMKDDLPKETAARDRLLLDILGLPELNERFGIGHDSQSSKIAIIHPAGGQDADIDYFFAQGNLTKQTIDTSVSCGNILSAVGPFAIETGLVEVTVPETSVGVLCVNTNVLARVIVQTPAGKVRYDGDTRIDGVAGSAAPVLVNFINSEGSVTGQVLPTGQACDLVEGVEISCVDAAMPVVMALAADFGKTGHESAEILNRDTALLARIEAVRLVAGRLMGLGDVSHLVMPKFALLSPPIGKEGICSRYFTPWAAHTSHAVTGALCVATACLIPGTVAARVYQGAAGGRVQAGPQKEVIEHPAGIIEVEMELRDRDGWITIPEAAFIRTAAALFKGVYHVH